MILAIDTSIGTSVALVTAHGTVLAARSDAGTRGHAEAIGTFISDALADVGARASSVAAVAVGMGPGPFTGLRVGIAAARAFAFGRGIEVWPVNSHDAAASTFEGSGEFAVVTDAKRREHYLSVYRGVVDGVPERVSGPSLVRLDEVAVPEQVVTPGFVDAASVARLAVALSARGLATGPAQPLYLREPDVTISAGPKRVTS